MPKTLLSGSVSRAGSLRVLAVCVGALVVSQVQADGPVPTKAPNSTPAKGQSDTERMLAFGSEAQQLKTLVGTWDVVMTIRPTPRAGPMVVRGLVAERTMIGLYLQEVMRPAPGSKLPDFQRIDYLTFDRVQARWEYSSMDTRAPIGIMFAKSYASEPTSDITVYFDNFANPGLSGTLGGSVRARHVDRRLSDDKHVKQQYWTQPGDAEWLAIEYEYARRR